MHNTVNNPTRYYRNLTPEEKLLQSLLLYNNARELKKSYLKSRYPEFSEEEIEKKLKEVFNHAAR